MMWKAGWLWSQCRLIGLNLELIWGTPVYFAFLSCHQCPSRLLTVILGSLWCSVKQLKAPLVFAGEHGIALCAMQRNQALSCGEGKTHGFSRVAAGTWGIFSSYSGDGHSKLVFVQRSQDSCLVTRDTSGICSRLGCAIQMLFKVRQETECPFLVATLILGFQSIFRNSQASPPFETLDCA